MKKISVLILLLLPLFCFSQDESTSLDFSAYHSRAKADSVLEAIENHHSLKMLYSVRNTEYYIIVKKDNIYEEFFIVAKEIKDLKITRLKGEKHKRRMFRRIFELKKYHTDLITKMPNAKFIQGDLSYFVVKDKNGNRFGEFSLPFLTVPSPIDKKIYAFITTKIAELSLRIK